MQPKDSLELRVLTLFEVSHELSLWRAEELSKDR